MIIILSYFFFEIVDYLWYIWVYVSNLEGFKYLNIVKRSLFGSLKKIMLFKIKKWVFWFKNYWGELIGEKIVNWSRVDLIGFIIKYNYF